MILNRIVVVDDEAIQRNMLSEIVKKITPKSQVTACANGQEAYQCIVEKGAELLITDISMPVMDGLTLIEKISAEFPEIKIVLVSAYQEFDYAKKAIQCGVTDYLIKPFRVEEARKLIVKIEEALEHEQEKKQRLNQYDSLMKDSRKKEQEKKLYQLITGRLQRNQLDAEILEKFKEKGVIVVVRWKLLQNMARDRVRITERQQGQILSQLQFGFPDACFVMLENWLDKSERKAAVLIPGKTSAEVSYGCRQILNVLHREGIVFWVGVSNTKQRLLEDAVDALRQAEEALAFCFYQPQEGGCFEYSEQNNIMNLPIPSVTVYEKRLRTEICKGGAIAVKEILADLKRNFGEILLFPNKVKHQISSMTVAVMKELEGMIPPEEYDRLLNNAYQRFAECDSMQSLFQIAQELLEKSAFCFAQSRENHDVIENVIAYIHAHLQEDISVQSLADQFHFHPNYLSAQLKERTGESCVNYILSLRMRKARRMLVETDLRVVEIAGECGFRDSSYFNRAFRKKYELSPEQYRKVHKTC